MMGVKKKYALIGITSLIVLIVITVFSVFFGSKSINLSMIAKTLEQGSFQTLNQSIVLKRIIRTLFGVLCGGVLGISGVLMQAVTRNPLADPSILGVNNGAAFFIVCGLTFFQIHSLKEYILFSLLGSLVAFGGVLLIVTSAGRQASPIFFILSGMSVSVLFSSGVTILMLLDQYAADQFRYWQLGSLGSASKQTTIILAIVFLLGLLISLNLTPALNALALGESFSVSLGANPRVIRIASSLVGVILCAFATAFAGPIGFIGLLATHLARLVVGSSYFELILFSPLFGAILLPLADTIGRILGAPGEINVGVMTALIGAPTLIYLARKGEQH
ncbi:FecCD family ABC transporter permease [Liquorilactobacillus ghanensis]|uniref:FecCD family ABC transporter permease n=2 Tax=Liquorilactobacillus ghanensis TaxID=399370 RepID=UPI0039E9ABD1